MENDKLLMQAVQEGIREGIKTKLAGYNSPLALDKTINNVIVENESAFRKLMSEAIAAALADENFRLGGQIMLDNAADPTLNHLDFKPEIKAALAATSGPLTVDRLRGLVESADKLWAVVLAGDDASVQYVTWGKEAKHKVFASDLSEEISAWVDKDGCTLLSPSKGPVEITESFKLDAAKNKAEVERLRAVVKDMQHRLDTMNALLDA